MQVIRIAGKVFGAKLTNAEKEALKIVARQAAAEATDEHCADIDATFLWVLHEVCGFGQKRLHDVYTAYVPALKALCEYYSMETEEEGGWLCRHKLKEIGVDISQWRQEVEKQLEENNGKD